MNRIPVAAPIITIGGSAGALGPLLQILGALPEGFPASVLVVLHTSPESPGLLPTILQRSCALDVRHADDGLAIEAGTVYVARPDRHLLVTSGGMKLSRAARENRARPAIDPLFRTAARSFGPAAVGVLLSGFLNDGTYGLMSIKREGGVTVVQDPAQAEYRDMPQNALDDVDVDHVLPPVGIADLLKRLSSQRTERRSVDMRRDEEASADRVDAQAHSSVDDPPAGELAPFVCPDCGGALWETMEGRLTRYRCHVGHAFTGDHLLAGMDEELEGALWSALRAIEENVSLSRRLAERASDAGHGTTAQQHQEHAAEMEQRAALLQRLLCLDDYGRTRDTREPVSR